MAVNFIAKKFLKNKKTGGTGRGTVPRPDFIALFSAVLMGVAPYRSVVSFSVIMIGVRQSSEAVFIGDVPSQVWVVISKLQIYYKLTIV